MQKYEVQVRSIGQLHATQLAVGNDTETGFALSLRRRECRRTVLFHEIRPGNIQRPVKDDFGKLRQTVADFHDWQIAAVISNRDTKQIGTLKLAKNFHLTLTVSGFDAVGALPEFFSHNRCSDRRGMQPRVQQFVEQQWISCDLLRQVGTVFAQADEASKNGRILNEQGNVSTTPQYLAYDLENPLEDGIGDFPVLQLQQQQWHEAAEPALHLFGYAVEPMSKTTFYFAIGVLVIVDLIQSGYQKKLELERAREQAD